MRSHRCLKSQLCCFSSPLLLQALLLGPSCLHLLQNQSSHHPHPRWTRLLRPMSFHPLRPLKKRILRPPLSSLAGLSQLQAPSLQVETHRWMTLPPKRTMQGPSAFVFLVTRVFWRVQLAFSPLPWASPLTPPNRTRSKTLGRLVSSLVEPLVLACSKHSDM